MTFVVDTSRPEDYWAELSLLANEEARRSGIVLPTMTGSGHHSSCIKIVQGLVNDDGAYNAVLAHRVKWVQAALNACEGLTLEELQKGVVLGPASPAADPVTSHFILELFATGWDVPPPVLRTALRCTLPSVGEAT